MRRLYRKFLHVFNLIYNFLRIVHLRMKYSGLRISFSTTMENSVSIVCAKGSTLLITNSHISFGTEISVDHGGYISIKDSHIGNNCIIGARKSIVINSDCQIAEMVVIRDQDHNFENANSLIKEQGFISDPISINENVWIGAKASILKGVTIGKNSVIGAHTLVTKDVESNSLYAGTPARKIKDI